MFVLSPFNGIQGNRCVERDEAPAVMNRERKQEKKRERKLAAAAAAEQGETTMGDTSDEAPDEASDDTSPAPTADEDRQPETSTVLGTP